MTPSALNRAVARATGETVSEISRRGFSLADPDEVHHDPEPYIGQPSVIDWDDLHDLPLPRRYHRRHKSVAA